MKVYVVTKDGSEMVAFGSAHRAAVEALGNWHSDKKYTRQDVLDIVRRLRDWPCFVFPGSGVRVEKLTLS